MGFSRDNNQSKIVTSKLSVCVRLKTNVIFLVDSRRNIMILRKELVYTFHPKSEECFGYETIHPIRSMEVQL